MLGMLLVQCGVHSNDQINLWRKTSWVDHQQLYSQSSVSHIKMLGCLTCMSPAHCRLQPYESLRFHTDFNNSTKSILCVFLSLSSWNISFVCLWTGWKEGGGCPFCAYNTKCLCWSPYVLHVNSISSSSRSPHLTSDMGCMRLLPTDTDNIFVNSILTYTLSISPQRQTVSHVACAFVCWIFVLFFKRNTNELHAWCLRDHTTSDAHTGDGVCFYSSGQKMFLKNKLVSYTYCTRRRSDNWWNGGNVCVEKKGELIVCGNVSEVLNKLSDWKWQAMTEEIKSLHTNIS